MLIEEFRSSSISNEIFIKFRTWKTKDCDLVTCPTGRDITEVKDCKCPLDVRTDRSGGPGLRYFYWDPSLSCKGRYRPFPGFRTFLPTESLSRNRPHTARSRSSCLWKISYLSEYEVTEGVFPVGRWWMFTLVGKCLESWISVRTLWITRCLDLL